MSENNKIWDQATFDQKMRDSQAELTELRVQLQELLVRFGIRALKTFQATRNLPLKTNEIERLVKYEIDNVAADLSDKSILDPIIAQVKASWEKLQNS
jgi:hypothetical protein